MARIPLTLKLTDFGTLAKAGEPAAACGTIGYAPPEGLDVLMRAKGFWARLTGLAKSKVTQVRPLILPLIFPAGAQVTPTLAFDAWTVGPLVWMCLTGLGPFADVPTKALYKAVTTFDVRASLLPHFQRV